MSMNGLTCDPVGTIVHIGMRVPVLGMLMCAGVVSGGMSMMGEPDAFGGCGETGGELHRVVALTEDPEKICAVPEAAPVQKEPVTD